MSSHFPQARLEYYFPSVHRIADLVVISKKLIFEIQCSPISLEEVQRRNQDYASLGFKVIWILHHKRFNQKTLSPAELYLRCRHLSYFASVTQDNSKVFFYDQFEFFDGMRRIYKSPPFVLQSFLPCTLSSIPHTFPKTIKKKLSHSPFYLPGDLADHLLKGKDGGWIHTLEKEHLPSPFKRSINLSRDFFLYLLYLNRSVVR